MNWTGLSEKFAALSTREKSLIAATGIILILLVGFTFLIEPAMKNIQRMQLELSTAVSQTSSLQAQKSLYEEALAEDPDAELKAQLSQLNKRHELLAKRFAEQLAELVSPAEMALLIEQVFTHAKGLSLEEMSSVAPENLFADSAEMEGVALYQHGLSLTFSGKFFAVRDFLAALEASNQQFYWRSINYEVKEYPQAEVTLEVYTLSSDEAFIGVR